MRNGEIRGHVISRLRTLGVAAALCAVAPSALAGPACDAALAALRDIHPGAYPTVLDGMGNTLRVRLVMNDAGECLSRAYFADSGQDRCGWMDANTRIAPVRPPAKATLNALASTRIENATMACPTLRRATQEKLGWQKSGSRALRLKRNGLYDHRSVGITLPVVNSAEGEAITWVESLSGPLAGGAGFVLLRMDAKGRWQVDAKFPALIS